MVPSLALPNPHPIPIGTPAQHSCQPPLRGARAGSGPRPGSSGLGQRAEIATRWSAPRS
jgi:hypothetical protein